MISLISPPCNDPFLCSPPPVGGGSGGGGIIPFHIRERGGVRVKIFFLYLTNRAWRQTIFRIPSRTKKGGPFGPPFNRLSGYEFIRLLYFTKGAGIG
jgi:hypothetical protein